MVFFAPLVGAATLFAGLVSALPRPDSAIGSEVAVSAPNGVVLSDTAALASATASASMMGYPAAATSMMAMSMSSMMTQASATSMMGGSYATATASAMASSMTYGSGSNNWGSSGYDSCVQQCMASFGAPPAMYTPPPSATASSGSSGSGSTITVIVAPTQGVLRYVPFAVNASVGDTVRFVWNANNHTVTKSSQLEICNKTSASPFVSGTQNKGFVFDQVVNDTQPTFYYCGTPGHCQKGMFGIINPPNAAMASTSVSMMMPSLASNDSTLSAMNTYANNMTTGNYHAANWGGNIDMGQMPSWSHQYLAENVAYTRTFLGANPDVLTADGTVNMGTTAPLMIPQDVSVAVNNAGAAPSGAAAASGSASSTAASSAASASSSAATSGKSTSGAASTAASSVLFAVAAIAATVLAL